jgi:hypothetical protein
MDGFDHYNTNQLPDKGWATGNGSPAIGGSGRFGGSNLELGGLSREYVTKNFGVNKTTIYFGVAIQKYEGGNPTYQSSDPFCRFEDESGVTQVRLHVLSDFSISAYQGDGTLLGTSAVGSFIDANWFYFEAKVTISATVGEVTLRVNTTQILNLTSKDTKNGSDYIRQIELGDIESSLSVRYDDLYIDDAQFNGDCRIKIFTPDSVSSTNNSFTASAGNKDECVDETPSNEDTDYIYSDTLNHKQGFGITTGSLSTVKGIQLNNHCRLDQAGTRKITPLIRSNSTDYSGTETGAIPADYKFESEIFETDPDDSSAWTQTKLEAAEFGLEITT